MLKIVLPLSLSIVVVATTAHALGVPETPAVSKPQKTTEQSVATVQLPLSPMTVGPLIWSPLEPYIIPVQGTDGRIHSIYELQITNVSSGDVTIDNLEVLDARKHALSGKNINYSVDGINISGKLHPFSVPKNLQEASYYTNKLPAGAAGIAYFDIIYPKRKDVPELFRHNFVTPLEDTKQKIAEIDDGIAVSKEAPSVITPPLKGSNWFNANGVGSIIAAHRSSKQQANGTLRSPEHFAIDFVLLKVDEKTHAYHTYQGDPSKVESWFSYGSEIFSATPGIVVTVVNNLPDQVNVGTITGMSPFRPEDYGGNRVIVQFDKKKYALYAHMAPGSIVVKEGDYVLQGQLLGKLGSSGNSDAPHLHFQIMDTASGLNTNGLPFVFDRMRYQGHFTGSMNDVGDQLFTYYNGVANLNTDKAGIRTGQIPLTLDLLEFE